jgi:hypothetical protein
MRAWNKTYRRPTAPRLDRRRTTPAGRAKRVVFIAHSPQISYRHRRKLETFLTDTVSSSRSAHSAGNQSILKLGKYRARMFNWKAIISR